MNKLIKLMLKLVVATALVSSAVGCANLPRLGGNQSANQTNQPNQVEPSPAATSNQPVNQVPIQRTNQPNSTTTQAPNNNQETAQVPQGTVGQTSTGTAQAPQSTVGQGGTGTTEPLESDTNQPVPALW